MTHPRRDSEVGAATADWLPAWLPGEVPLLQIASLNEPRPRAGQAILRFPWLACLEAPFAKAMPARADHCD